ncbi:MAG: hypothetical protein ACOC45_06800 [Alkalispirochaetaceae bacterium]
MGQAQHTRNPARGGSVSTGAWTQQINTMMLRNLLIKTNIGPQELEAEFAEEMVDGGINGATNNAPLKPYGGLGHGLTNRIPKEEHTGRLEKAHAPIGVVNRSNGESYDYADFDEMIDDGWAVD